MIVTISEGLGINRVFLDPLLRDHAVQVHKLGADLNMDLLIFCKGGETRIGKVLGLVAKLSPLLVSGRSKKDALAASDQVDGVL